MSDLCTCGHPELLHELYRPTSRPAYRRKCSVGALAGSCPCTCYTPTRTESPTQ